MNSILTLSVKEANVGRPCLFSYGPLNPIKSMFYTHQICTTAPIEKLKPAPSDLCESWPFTLIPIRSLSRGWEQKPSTTCTTSSTGSGIGRERANPGTVVGRVLISQQNLLPRHAEGLGRESHSLFLLLSFPPTAGLKSDFVSLCHELPLGHFWSKAQKSLQHFLIS